MSNPILKETMGRALGLIPSGVALLTARHKKEFMAVITSFFQQASFEPPLVSVSIKSHRPIGEMIRASGFFVLNLLHIEQKKLLAALSAQANSANPLEGIATFSKSPTHIPILKDALCFLECELGAVYPAGDHQIYLGEVTGAGMSNVKDPPMIHLRKNGWNY